MQLEIWPSVCEEPGAHGLAHQHIHLCENSQDTRGQAMHISVPCVACESVLDSAQTVSGPNCARRRAFVRMQKCVCRSALFGHVAAWIERRIRGSFTAPTLVTAGCCA